MQKSPTLWISWGDKRQSISRLASKIVVMGRQKAKDNHARVKKLWAILLFFTHFSFIVFTYLVGFSMHTGLGIKTVPYDSRSDVLMYKIIWEGVLKVMIAVSNILPLPNHPLIKGRELDFYCFPPLQGGG